MFFAYGEERLLDAGRRVAKLASEGGAVVHFHQYDQLPHVFGLLFPKIPQSQHVLAEWAKFCHTCVHEPKSLGSKNVRYKVTGEGFREVDNGAFSALPYETAMELMRKEQAQRRGWNGPKQAPNL